MNMLEEKLMPEKGFGGFGDMQNWSLLDVLTSIECPLQASFIEQDGTIIALDGRLAEILGEDTDDLAAVRLLTLSGNGNHDPAQPIRFTKNDGQSIWLQCQYREFEYGGRTARLGSVVDLTCQEMLHSCVREMLSEKFRLAVKRFDAQEVERKRIGIDLHDSVGQYLTVLKLRIEQFVERSDKQSQARSFLEELIPMIQAATEELRRCILALRPPLLDNLGLEAALNCLIREFESILTSVEVRTRIRLVEQSFGSQLDIVIYRVVQESLDNIAKHANADSVTIVLEQIDQAIQLSIEDDGVGFSIDAVHNSTNPSSGSGLYGMKERVFLSQGDFLISSGYGSGTKVQAVWNRR